MRARISVNEVRQLEFGTWGPDQEIIGSAAKILADLERWSARLAFGQRGLEYLSRGKSYLHGMHRSEGAGVVLCLWHESPLVDGKQLVADETDGTVTAEEVAEGKIPGVPAYYWFPPLLTSQCGIKLPDRPASRGKLVNFLKAFMTQACSIVNHTSHTDDESAEVVLCKTKDGRPVRAIVDFITGTRKDLGDLRNQLDKVRAIERKETIAHATEQIPKLLKRFFGYEEDQVPNTTKVHYKLDVPEGISMNLFDEIVEFYTERDDQDLDIGFHKAGQEIQWLSSRRLVSTHDLDVAERDGVVRNLEQLASELSQRRKSILGGRVS